MMAIEKTKTFLKRSSLALSTVGVVLAYALYVYVQSRPAESEVDPVGVLVAERQLVAGTAIRATDFRLATTGDFPSDVMTDQALGQLENMSLARALESGEALTLSHVKPSKNIGLKVKRGYRAYPIRVSLEHPASATDSVDVLGIPKDQKSYPTVLVESASVLQVRTMRDYRVLVLSIHKSKLAHLERALQVGSLSVILASRYDIKEPQNKRPGPPKSGLPAKRRRRLKRVEIING